MKDHDPLPSGEGPFFLIFTHRYSDRLTTRARKRRLIYHCGEIRKMSVRKMAANHIIIDTLFIDGSSNGV